MPQPVQRRREPWTFVLPADRELPVEQQTKFKLRPMDVAERADAIDGYRRELVLPGGIVENQRQDQRQSLELVLSHIVAIDNFPPAAPAPWPTDRDARLRYLDQFTDADLAMIGTEIWLESFVPLGETVSAAELRRSARAKDVDGAGSGLEQRTA